PSARESPLRHAHPDHAPDDLPVSTPSARESRPRRSSGSGGRERHTEVSTPSARESRLRPWKTGFYYGGLKDRFQPRLHGSRDCDLYATHEEVDRDLDRFNPVCTG